MGDSDDLLRLDACAQAEAVRSGEVSAVELVQAAIDRSTAVHPHINAVIHDRGDKARAEAAGDLPDGPFRGVPMVVKDLSCHTAGDPFCEGMRFLRDRGWVEPHDTWLAARFKSAGFVVIGKTNTPELGLLPTTEPAAFGPTRNPWDSTRSAGGSSGGSAAAVAAGVVAVGHANDGGGSIRIPASECGLVGLKPSRGRVSLAPDFGDVMGGLVCELAVTRSVRDTAAVLDAVHGAAPGDPYVAPPPLRPYIDEVGADPGRLRIGVRSAAFGATAVTHPSCVAAADATAKLLESLGHRVDDLDAPVFDEADYVAHFITNWSAGAAWNLDYWAARVGEPIGPDDVEPLSWALAEAGRSVSAPAWLAAREWLQAYARRVADLWSHDDGIDLLLTPTIAEPPPPLGTFDSPPDNPLQGLFRAADLVPFTPVFNVSGQPAISLPLHVDDDGLPIGVQLVAPLGREDVLLRVAAQLEIASPWADRVAPLR